MKKVKKILKILMFCLLGIFIIYVGIYLYAWINPKLAISNANSYYFYDISDNLITGTNDWIDYSKIDSDVINATLSIEDRHFFKHQGFDYLRILKAMFDNITSQSTTSGASTITQQYAKNLYLTFDQTWERKINEAWLTVRLETHYTKEEILEGYLNTINYGGIYGIENASKYYFGKNASDLTIAEASMLAGIPNRPSDYSPFNNLEAAKARQQTVLKAMLRDKYITEDEYNDATSEELVYATNNDERDLTSAMYYQDAVANELQSISSIPSSFLTTGGLKIYTNLNVNVQSSIETAIKTYIKDDVQTACVVIDPNNGQVLGLVGGVDYIKSQYNRATNINRSVGSTIKPFLYYTALENNFTASSTFTSEKTSFVFSDNQTYSPTNFSNIYANKKISLAAAIAYSDNIYAVKTHLFLGENALVETMKRVGINYLNSIPSLALGSEAISLLDMTSAYSVLASEGYKNEPYFIRKVEDVNGNVLYEHKDNSELVLNKNLTFILNELLTNTSNPNFVSYTYPTAYTIIPKLTKKYGIKTGTTDSDHLIFGFNKDVVVGMWAGYDDNHNISNDDCYNNKQMWADIIESYTKDKGDDWYDIPENVVGVMVDGVSGEIANTNTKNGVILYYIKGTEPTANYTLDEIIPTTNVDE